MSWLRALKKRRLTASLSRSCGAVAEPGFGAEQDGDAEGVGGEDAVQRVDAGVAVDPEGVEGVASRRGPARRAVDAVADGAEGAFGAGVAEDGEELVLVAVEEGDVPGDFDAEALVLVAADGEVGAEEDGEVDVGLLRRCGGAAGPGTGWGG